MTTHRFAWLDAARGFAALSVMIYHYNPELGLLPFFRSSFLAVDLFFVMSGFVLAHSYDAKLLCGTMSFGRFVLVRLIRLWPLYAAATLLGAAYYGAKIAMGRDDAPPLGEMLRQVGFNLAFIPAPTDLPQVGGIFPFAPASWSLSIEMIGSLLFGAFLVRLRTRGLTVMAAMLVLAVIGRAAQFGTLDLGWGRDSFGGGVLRMTAEMTLGILVYRHHRQTWSGSALPTAWLVVASLCSFAAFSVVPRGQIMAEAFFALAVFPALIAIAARVPAHGRSIAVADALGRMSYPVYLLHVPVLMWIAGIMKIVPATAPYAEAAVARWVALVSTLVASAILLRYFDEPLRKRLSAAVRRRSARAPVAVVVGSGSI